MAPCNCGGKGAKKMVYDYVFKGQKKTYNTEVEARAAVIRNGGGTVTPRTA